MEKEWKSGEAIWHMKQAERNALDVAAMNKLNEIVDVATLRQRVAELENERDKLLESLDTAVKAIIIFRNEPALERLHSLRSSNGYGVLQQAMDIGLDVITRVKGGAA